MTDHITPLQSGDPRRIGRFRCVGVLGSGGMGRVLLGIGADDRPVAIKLVHRHLADVADFRERFRREIAASARVSGAFTAPVVDADADAEQPWFASVYIAGPTLVDAVAAQGRFPADSVRALAIGLARALQDIHRVGLVHRDLKPSNVLLAADGPRVIDFGIARSADGVTALTHEGALLGSPAYMAPEQALSQPATQASDVYSLGAVVALAARGAPPFAGKTVPAILYNIINSEPELSGIAAEFVPILRACLAKDPTRRPDPTVIMQAFSPVRHADSPWPAPIVQEIDDRRAEVDHAPTGVAPLAEPEPTRRRWPIVLAAAVVVAIGATVAVGLGTRPHPTPTPEPAKELTPVSLADLRSVDTCALLGAAVGGEATIDPDSRSAWGDCGIDAGELTYWLDLGTVRDVGVSTANATEHSPGGFPIATVTSSSRGCSLLADPTGTGETATTLRVRSEGAETCAPAREVFGTVLDRLASEPPLTPSEPGSLSAVDPCGLTDAQTLGPIVGTPSAGTPVTIHYCEWGARVGIEIRLGADKVPADGALTTTVDGNEFFEADDAVIDTACAMVYRHPAGAGFESVTLTASGYSGTHQSYCDTAVAVLATVIPRLG